MSNATPPRGLGAAGESLWTAHVTKYDLRVDELAVLHGACRAADMVVKFEDDWASGDCPIYTKGSMGQLVEHPASKGIRSWQQAQDTALARLKLPDDPAGEKPNQQRDAANSRWAQAHGKGA